MQAADDRYRIMVRQFQRVGRLMMQGRDRDLEDLGLTSIQADALLFFDRYPHSQINGLRDHLNVSHQAACGLVDRMKTKGPWNEEVDSFYGMLPDGTAIIEMAASAGLPQVGDRKDPSRTTTYGVGELILAAARSGAKRLVIGLGGSTTNDAGCGAAAACGVRFLDKDGRSFVPVGGTLGDIASIDLSGMDGKVKDMPITAMCDIDNPFYGPTGAAAIFGPQKGADEAMVADLDGKMKHLASVIEEQIGVDLQEIPGSGAAGGMGGGMKAFNDRFNYYADSAMHIELKYQMAILMPFIILFFILSVFVVNRILHKTGLDLRLSGKTEKGTSFRNS